MSTQHMSIRGFVWLLAAALAAGLLFACGLGTSSPTSSASAAGTPASLQSDYVKLVKDVSPSVVMVETPTGLGSGIIYDAQGDIVTNNHVVAGAQTIVVVTSTGKQYPAALVGTFAADDLAVVRVQASGLTPATFANSSNLQVGDIVMAMGNPLGLRASVTQGIVSGERTSVPEGNGVTLPSAIQTGRSSGRSEFCATCAPTNGSCAI